MKKNSLIPISIIAIAGIGLFVVSNNLPVKTHEPDDPDRSAIVQETGPEQCAYTWAYHDLPEISSEFSGDVKNVIQDAEAHATAYGEDCLYEDGRVAFTVMETDFYVLIPVGDLADDRELGNFVENTLTIVNKFSPLKVPGPKEGFVEITFRNGENIRVLRVPIPLGKTILLQGLHGEELIQALEK